MKKKQLIIAIDPGFDGCKIIINKRKYCIPFVVQDITNDLDNYNIRRKDDAFIRCEMNKKMYIVGEVARTSLLNEAVNTGKQAILEDFYAIGRFDSELFKVGFNAFLGYALFLYSEYTIANKGVDTFLLEELDQWEMAIGVALPHEYTDKYAPVMEDLVLHTKHEFKLLIGDREVINFDFKPSYFLYNSQTVAALLSELIDDRGMEKGGKTIYDSLPALILDGGYKTLGEFEFARDQSIRKSISNQDFAMMNIDIKTAERIRKHIPNVYYYMIEEYYRNAEILHYIDDGKVKDIDVVQRKNEAITETAQQLVEYLLKKYNDLLDMKCILIAGGTGQIYYPFILEYCKENRSYLTDKIILASGKFDKEDNKEKEPVYAVAVGVYKGMVMQLMEDEE